MKDKASVTETEQVCARCGISFVEGVGFVGKHLFPCANEQHGWNFTVQKVIEPPAVPSALEG